VDIQRNLIIVSFVKKTNLSIKQMVACFTIKISVNLTFSIIPASTRTWYAPRENPVQNNLYTVKFGTWSTRTKQKYSIARFPMVANPLVRAENASFESAAAVVEIQC
jgi:hypothetical protein